MSHPPPSSAPGASERAPLKYHDFPLRFAHYDPDTGTFQVWVEGQTPGGAMRPGDAAQVVYIPTAFWDEPATGLGGLLGKLERHKLSRAGLFALGQRLADLALPIGPVRRLFEQNLAALQPGEGLRLRFRLDAGLLAQLPWEYLLLPRTSGEPTATDFFALRRELSIVRTDTVESKALRLAPRAKARVVGVFSSPGDLPALEVERDKQAIARGIAAHNQSAGYEQIEATWVEQPATRAALEAALSAGAEFFHYAGHAVFEPFLTQVGSLALETEEDKTDLYHGEQLAQLLRQTGIRLAVLGGCQTARRDGQLLWSGIAPALTREHIPAVIAHQFPIRDANAHIFASKLYQYLLAGFTVDEALFEARQAIFQQQGLESIDWGVPVLYLRDQSDVLFLRPTTRPSDSIVFPDRRLLGFLPFIRTPIGRDPLLQKLKQQLKGPPRTPFVVLHGQAGVGKTTIAAQLAADEELSATFSGVLWANLGSEPALDDILAIWASQLGADLSSATSIQEKLGHIQEKLGREPFLLILDDLWAVKPTIEPLLRMAGPGWATLVTTRERAVAEKLITMVRGMQVPVEEIDEGAALELLMEICHEKLTDPSVLRPLAKAAGGLPLTVELMGAYINSQLPVAFNPLELRQRLQRIEQHLRLPGDTGPRRLTLQEVIDLSVNELPDRRTKQAFFKLGAFAPKPATFSREAMQFVTRADRQILQHLYNRHLLHQSPSNRYTLHQALASAARAHLSSNDTSWVRHRIYYQEQIKQRILRGQNKSETIKDIDWRALFYDLPQMRAIRLPQRLEPAFSILVNRFSGTIPWLRWLDILPTWVKNWLSRALLIGLALFQLGTHLSGQQSMEAWLANFQGWLYAEEGLRTQALMYYERARELWAILGNRPRLAEVLNNLGKTCYMQAEYRLALKHYHQALNIRRALNDRRRQAHILTNIGAVFDMLNRPHWAIQSLRMALSHYQDVQDERGEANTLLILGTCYHGLGEREKMLFYLELALDKHRSARNDVGCARTLMELGLVYLDFPSLAQQEEEPDSLKIAMGYFQQALALQQKFGDLAWQGRTLSRIGQVYAKQGEVTKALDAYLQALSIHQHVDYKAGLSATLGLIADLFRVAGQDVWAQGIASEGKSMHAPNIELNFKQREE